MERPDPDNSGQDEIRVEGPSGGATILAVIAIIAAAAAVLHYLGILRL